MIRPGGNQPFGSFTNPVAVRNGEVVFISGVGIYRYTQGSISIVADETTPIPNGNGSFTGFATSFANFDGEAIAFVGTGTNSQKGVYLSRQGNISRVADRSTAIPGGSGSFGNLEWATVGGDVVSFNGSGDTEKGIYRWTSGDGLTVLADRNTIIPGTTTTKFTDLTVPFTSEGNTAFLGWDSTGNRLYITTGNGLQAIPGTEFSGDPALDGLDLVSYGAGKAIYKIINGQLTSVVGHSAPGIAVITFWSLASISDGDTAFRVSGGGTSGIFREYAGSLVPILYTGDVLDGKQVTSVLTGLQAIDGADVVFSVGFSDGTSGVYLSSIPEPATGALFVAVCFWGLVRNRTLIGFRIETRAL